MQQAIEEIQKEVLDTLKKYKSTVGRLGEVERERDGFKMKHDQARSIITLQSQELREKQQLSATLKKEIRVLKMKLNTQALRQENVRNCVLCAICDLHVSGY